MGRKVSLSGLIISSISQSISDSRERKYYSSSSNYTNPEYELTEFKYDKESRVARFVVEKTTYHRKIIRYVTRNYVRTPIYSDWYKKINKYQKSIKLTNEELENLNHNSDFLIAKFSFDIVQKMKEHTLRPSWYLRELYLREKNYRMDNAISAIMDEKNKHKITMNEYDKEINIQTSRLKKEQNKIMLLEYKAKRLEKKLNFSLEKKNLLLKAIFTLGIILLLKSGRRISILKIRAQYLKNDIDEANKKCEDLLNTIKEINEKKDQEVNNYNLRVNELNKRKIDVLENYRLKIEQITPLPVEYSADNNDFIPLKIFVGYQYKKIIGVYIIHNKEFDKYYVGQSKDVFKRITRGHFSGTTIKNIIFAEDYFKSNYEKKDEIFEVKIIELQTKDELDKVEREMILKYDSFVNGYNGTSGNTWA